MTVSTDTRSNRIAVFIDFDNVEIGVKNTIGGQLDIGLVLEAIKERGEIVTKIACSDWKRAGVYSRLLTQHASRMEQRNVTPGGDENGADITMALDALEMAFTHDHRIAVEIVTKIAYSDSSRACDYSRLLTQHAIWIVQRNSTPDVDKDGADITMALDALEMAFTSDPVKSYIILGVDSDFISVVEELRLYG